MREIKLLKAGKMFVFWVLHLAYSRGPHTAVISLIFTQTTSKEAVPCKDVFFGGFESKKMKNRHLWDRFWRDFEFFLPKTA